MKVEGTMENEMKAKEAHEEHGMDIKKYFKHEFPDEMKGCNEYCDLARQAEKAGDRQLAYGLYEMAKDEYTHAKFIHDHLIEWGCEIPEAEMTKFHQTKERIARIFR